MSKPSILGQSRAANIAFLMLWISILSIDVYFITTHLHTMDLSKKVGAGAFAFSALFWIKMVIKALRTEE